MGVVYKFRKEVIDFVLQQKRTDNDLGCRQLAVLTSEKFKIQVSKSSVNAIIKNANLSNAVGRPPSDESVPKKFQIPLEKKQQLLDEVRKVKLEQKPLSFKTLPPPQRAPATTQPRKDPAVSLPRNEPGPSQPKKAPVVEPQNRGFSQAIFLRHVENLRARRTQPKGVLREGMGCVFLKAAQWQLSRTSVPGGLLRKYIPKPLLAQFDIFCDLLSCWSLLGVSEPDRIGRLTNHALWDLGGLGQPLTDTELLHWNNVVQGVPPSVKFSLEYENEKRRALMEVKRFEFYLETDKRITTDARLTGLGEENFKGGSSGCIEQAMALLSHCVISNNQPAIFLSSGGRPSSEGKQVFPEAVMDMVAAFEGIEGRQFKKVIAFDGAQEQIAEFAVFPRKKRFFMLGVWPGQEEFSLLSKSIRSVEPFYDEVTDKIFYVTAGPAAIFENELKLKGAPLRSITVLEAPDGAPLMVILTNCADKAPTDIFQAFLRRWPNLDAGPAGRGFYTQEALQETGSEYTRFLQAIKKDDADILLQIGKNPFVALQDWGRTLNQYCQKYFFGEEFFRFDVSQLISIFYSLKGYCAAQEHVLLVSLSLPREYSHLNELQQVIQRINEAGICDPSGRFLHINILK